MSRNSGSLSGKTALPTTGYFNFVDCNCFGHERMADGQLRWATAMAVTRTLLDTVYTAYAGLKSMPKCVLKHCFVDAFCNTHIHTRRHSRAQDDCLRPAGVAGPCHGQCIGCSQQKPTPNR